MLRKISTVLLSFLLVWYAAMQAEEEKPEKKVSGISVYAPLRSEGLCESVEEIYGQIRLTAIVRSIKEETPVVVEFLLESDTDTYRKSVEITEACQDEKDFFSATAVFSDLKSGVYTASVTDAKGVELDYILTDDGVGSDYVLNRESVSFELHYASRFASADFMMKEIKAV